MTRTLTDEQIAIVDAVKAGETSVMADALAGCAKSTTMEESIKAKRSERSLLLVFNARNKKDLEPRMPESVQVKTLNGLGHAAWGKAIGRRCELDDRKLGRIITTIAAEANLKLGTDQWTSIRQLVTAAMTQGLVPALPGLPYKGLVEDTPEVWAAIAQDSWIEINEECIEIARATLVRSIKESLFGKISFDDQIYCSTMLGGVFDKYPFVGTDESQDFNPLNHIMVVKSVSERMLVVGDPNQAIYAWRGASHDSMQRLRALRPAWLDRPLTMTFRVPRVLVQRQLDFVPAFRAHENNKEGYFARLGKAVSEGAAREWRWSDVMDLHEPGEKIMLICRNNAPLLKMAFKLIKGGVGVVMIGRDIGKGLVALSQKIIPEDRTAIPDCVIRINDWGASQIALALANQDPAKADTIGDKTECLLAVIEGGSLRDAGDLRAKLKDLFARERGLVELSSGHRAKGMEADLVVHLDPWRLPSKFAQQQAAAGDDRALRQENNLRYVIDTRSKNKLLYANVEDFHD